MSDERRLVTVLFADVVGSTGLAARLDAEDWKTVINGAFASLTRPIDRYDGTIAQYLGDGFLAFFGAPVAHEDDAERAVRAALEVTEAARRYADEVRERLGAEFAVRVGINTGPVVFGAVGTDARHENLAVGDTVNVAARLQACAEPMTALISDSTRRLLRDGFDLDDMGLLEVRGLDRPIRAFSPRGAPVDTDAGRRSLPFASPMVGRMGELERLVSATGATRAGIGRVAVLLGESGIGKSRLLHEWRAVATEGETRWAQANMPPHASGMAYHLAGEAVRAMLGLAADAGPAELDVQLERTRLAAESDGAREYLADLLSIPLPDRVAIQPLSPQGRQARYIELTLAVARAVASEPLVLVLNDAHWSDPSSVALLTPLLGLHAELPLLVCITSRPDPHTAGWRLVEGARGLAGAGLVEISLEALALSDTEALLKNLLGAEALPHGLVDFVDGRAEGNPLFVEEIVRMLVDRGLLDRANGVWRFDGASSHEIPDTLQALLAARIDRLDGEARSALRVASVIGRRFSVAVLERLLERARMSTTAVLARLERTGLVRLERTDPEVEYLFRHALVQEAAYESIAREDRRTLHRAAGEILEELLTDKLDEAAGTLAYHFERAGLVERAVRYHVRAADRAATSFANAEAIDFYRAALDGAAADALEPLELALAHERYGEVLERVGRIDDAITQYERALDQAALGGSVRRSRLHRRVGNAHRIARRVAEARASFATATRLLDDVTSSGRQPDWWSERIDLLLDRAWLHYFWGSLAEMAAVLSECAPAIDAYANDAQRTRHFARQALLAIRSNHMIVTDEALALTRAAYDLWQSVGDPTDVELARFQLGFFHTLRGEFDRAVTHLQESLASAELTGDIVLQSRCLIYLAVVARFRRDPIEMERIHERAMPVILAGGMTEYEGMVAANRCWAAWRRGDTASARTHGTRALELSARLPAKYAIEPSARLPLLAMALEAGDAEAAHGHAIQLVDGALWVDTEYGHMLKAAIDAYEDGDTDRGGEQLRNALARAEERGWL